MHVKDFKSIFQIDYLILDTEGGELDLMQHIPWNKLDIRLLQVEYHVIKGFLFNRDLTVQRRQGMIDFMSQLEPGYDVLIDFVGSWSRDLVFTKKSREI